MADEKVDFGSGMLATQAEASSMTMFVRKGCIESYDFVMANPPGYSNDCMLRIGKCTTYLNMSKLVRTRGGAVEVTEMRIEHLTLNVEKPDWGGTSNVQKWSNDKFGEEPSQAEVNPPLDEEPWFTMHKIEVQDITVQMRKGDLQGISAKVDDIMYEDFQASKGGVDDRHISSLISSALLSLVQVASVQIIQGVSSGAAVAAGFVADGAVIGAGFVADSAVNGAQALVEHAPAAGAYLGNSMSHVVSTAAGGAAEHVPGAAAYVTNVATEHVPGAAAYVGSGIYSAATIAGTGISDLSSAWFASSPEVTAGASQLLPDAHATSR